MWNTLSELPLWAVVALALLSIVTAGGGTKAILDLARWAIERRDRLAQKSGITSVFLSVSKINSHLRTLRDVTNARRVLLLRASNGGSVPKPGSRLYSSAVYEIPAPGITPLAYTWQAQELDAHYVSMLVDIDQRGHVFLRTEDIPESTLRTAYDAEGIEIACFFDANGTRDSKLTYYYGSLTWADSSHIPPEPVLVNEVRVARTAIARELAKHEE